MAYYSGQVTSFIEIRDVLVNACLQNQDWSWDAATLVLKNESKHIFINITTDTLNIIFKGRTSANSGDTPYNCRIGRLCSLSPFGDMAFPAKYEIFFFDNEVYFLLNYSIDLFQWVAFGKSSFDFSSSGGTGMWISASLGGGPAGGPWYNNNPISIMSSQSGNNEGACIAPALFWMDGGWYENMWMQSFIHTNIDNSGWIFGAGGIYKSLSPLLDRQPNNWNNESLLSPIGVLKSRDSSKLSKILEFENCRALRIDNFEPNQVINLGHDKWKIFPWYKKDSTQRDGGKQIWHTGTFGWAIRYDGP